jgi:hypothetical protein
MKTMRYAVAVAMLVAQAPVAQAQSKQTVYTTVTKADLRLLVTLEGHTIIEEDFFDVPSVRAKTKDGLIFQVFGSGCTDGANKRCDSVMMQIRYDDDDRVTYEGINEANWKEALITAWWDQEGKTVGFTRFVVLDGGVTLMNLRQNLRKLFIYVPTVLKYPFP